MYRGYVKLWRKIGENGIMKNHGLLAFWIHCLTKASHKECEQIVGYQKIGLEPGQLIFGRKTFARELALSERKIRTCLEHFKKCEKMTIKSTNKYSVITITNWHLYQSERPATDQQPDQQPTSNRPATDHKQECKALKNEKNKTENPGCEKEKLSKEIDLIYFLLNKKMNTNYSSTYLTQTNLMGLLKNHSVDDFKKVIDQKYDDWDNDKMRGSLIPSVLFNVNKFPEYLESAKANGNSPTIEMSLEERKQYNETQRRKHE